MNTRNKIEKVSDTAKPVLAAKYVTSQPSFWKNKGCGNRETPLANNEASRIFLTNEDIEKAEKNPNIDNIKTASVRERWINKLFEQYVKNNGYKQIVILGSGFDTRPYKKNPQNQENKKNACVYSKIKFWEIDKPEILDEKEIIFKSQKLDKNATYIKADYTKTDFITMLFESGLNPKEPTLIILEGNLMYLEKDEAKEVFNKLKTLLNECVITFDYFPQSLVNMIASRTVKGSNESLWKTGIDDLQDFASKCGLTVVENRSIGELSKEYDVDNNPSTGANQYSVCALRK